MQAGAFADALFASDGWRCWAQLAGRWHDLGKYRPGFQRYVRQDENAHIEQRVAGRNKTHSAAGALWAAQHLEQTHGAQKGKLAARVLAYVIAGHHAGLADWEGDLAVRLASADSAKELAEALAAQPPGDILSAGDFTPSLSNIPGGANGFALRVRMLFSCLVDADFLDTEAHFDAGKPQRRSGFPTLAQMHAAFDSWMAQRPVRDTPVNVLRADILRQCRTQAALTPGFFSLTVPTGGGKTLSSLAFALQRRLTGSLRCAWAVVQMTMVALDGACATRCQGRPITTQPVELLARERGGCTGLARPG